MDSQDLDDKEDVDAEGEPDLDEEIVSDSQAEEELEAGGKILAPNSDNPIQG
jgi:hypothetical protein